MSEVRLRIRHKGGQDQLTVSPTTMLATLATQLAEKSGVPQQRLRLRIGFPPKPFMGAADMPVGEALTSGETLIVEESDEPSIPVVAAASEPLTTSALATSVMPTRPPAPTEAPPVNSSGVGVRRVVDADNSCLFTSMAYVMLGRDRARGADLREVVAREILADPVMYNEVVLNMEPNAYAAWIKGSEHWGGAIELAVLSDHFSTVIAAWDVQTMRTDRYGQDKGYNQCIHLIYDGLHYDALALSMLEESPPECEEFDITVFSPFDTYMDGQVKAVIAKLNTTRQFTDTSKFSLRCLVCQKGLVGEADAVEHAKATGHQNFAEYR